jgi:hypothetical protein
MTESSRRRPFKYLRPLLLTGTMVAVGANSCARIPPQEGHSSLSQEATWEADLGSYGFVLDEYEWAARVDPERQIAFGNGGHIVILNQSMGTDGRTKVRAFVVDSGTGNVTNRLEWTRGTPAYVFATASGNYAVLGESGTIMYSGDLSIEITSSPYSVEMVSPDGNRFAARTRRNGKEVWITMDAQTLEEAGVLPTGAGSSISGTGVAWLRSSPGEGRVVEILPNAGPPVKLKAAPGTERPYFVSEHAIVLVAEGRFDVVSDVGEHLFSGIVDDDGHHFSSSRGGSRIALTQQRWSEVKGGLATEMITVFDLEQKAPIWAREDKELRGEPNARSAVALSPDGSMIAIRSSRRVKLFRLPTGS